MKKYLLFLSAISMIILLTAGCDSKTDSSVEMDRNNEIDEMIEESDTTEEQNGVAFDNTEQVIVEEETSNVTTQKITVDNPSWDYYIETPAEVETVPLKLTLLEQTTNQITDEEEWFERNELTLPEFDDGEYQCRIEEGMLVDIIKNGTLAAILDFSEYRCANDGSEYKDFIEEDLRRAVICDGILYVSSFHYTYAEFEPRNAYITAIDLSDYSVLWKTKALTCNSLNFEIIGDVVLCGYGFTAEDDYLYQLDRKTGQIIDETPLKSMANYIVYKDEKLYVRTYNTDYVFQVER